MKQTIITAAMLLKRVYKIRAWLHRSDSIIIM